jgi:hypothetical protein
MKLQMKRYRAVVKAFLTVHRKIKLVGQFIWAGTFLELVFES